MTERRLIIGDCVEVMARMEACSVDAIVCDPPYGLEFMGKTWDRLDGDAWRSGGGFTKPGIGARATPWASFGRGDTANATCATCGGRMRGARKCSCEQPDWRVKGERLAGAGDSRQPGDATFQTADNPYGAAGVRYGVGGSYGATAELGRSMQVWHQTWAREALRVLKPGGYLLAFGGTRTYHRLACAVEDAGFEIRDRILVASESGEVIAEPHPTELAWMYGSG